ncbi:MAG: sulfatase [Planctomycetota bacterium]
MFWLWLLPACAPSPDRPNILLIVVDTLRADHLGCYGYQRATSPNLDRLAQDSIVFEDAVAPASFTQPSVATMLTGLTPPEHGVRRHPGALSEHCVTIAERLRGAGYRTGAFVSNALLAPRYGFAQGFDRFDAQGHRLAEATTGAAARWITEQRREPFFAYVHYIDPHFPYAAPVPEPRPFTVADGGGYAQLAKRFLAGTLPLDALWFAGEVQGSTLAAGRAEYDHEILYVDAAIQALLDRLHQLDLLERTWILVVGDHGEALGEHGLTFCHGFYTYQELLHVPLIVRPPGGCAGGRRATALVALTDIAPTILAAAGVNGSGELSGRSLLSPEPVRDRVVFSEGGPVYPPPGAAELLAVRGCRITVPGFAGKWLAATTARWQLLLVPTHGGPTFELYDRAQDPAELHDLYGERAGELRALREQLVRWRDSWPPETAPDAPDPNTRAALKELGY